MHARSRYFSVVIRAKKERRSVIRRSLIYDHSVDLWAG